MNLLKSILHNLGVLAVGFIFGFLGRGVDIVVGITEHQSTFRIMAGVAFLIVGFLLRVWATYYFYREHMNVIVLRPQEKLITSGPYRFTRNPLYLGGNVFIFLGAVLFLGSTSGIILTGIAIVATDIMIRREERQLASKFGEEWASYKARVPRWI
jgi:protein-S-isoprenylcysteine O-methyltransferase Ste14